MRVCLEVTLYYFCVFSQIIGIIIQFFYGMDYYLNRIDKSTYEVEFVFQSITIIVGTLAFRDPRTIPFRLGTRFITYQLTMFIVFVIIDTIDTLYDHPVGWVCSDCNRSEQISNSLELVFTLFFWLQHLVFWIYLDQLTNVLLVISMAMANITSLVIHLALYLICRIDEQKPMFEASLEGVIKNTQLFLMLNITTRLLEAYAFKLWDLDKSVHFSSRISIFRDQHSRTHTGLSWTYRTRASDLDSPFSPETYVQFGQHTFSS